MSWTGGLVGALKALIAAAPVSRFTGCEAHFAERLGLDRIGRTGRR